MSLIHDALKRAKAAEHHAPPPAAHGPPFRPIEPVQLARRGIGIALPVALAVVALLGLFLVWRVSQNRVRARSDEPPTQTATVEQPSQTPQSVSPPAPKSAVALTPSQAVPGPTPVPANTTPTTTAPSPVSTVDSSPSVLNGIKTPPKGTETALAIATSNSPASIPPVPPKPAPLRLQAILYHPQHPSAVVSGKTLFLGDRIGELRLVALDKETATLAGGGQTNVLSLDQ
jgi:hypothetical protein